MQKPEVIAIAAQPPLKQAFLSAHNSLLAIADFMYGTPERAKVTYMFAFSLLLLSMVISHEASALQACAS
ncbi:MAG: hypothetical protein SFT92_04620 [Rickettsiales bacterium]|nr:hypothetical protein [Rickettsiales bacterium]